MSRLPGTSYRFASEAQWGAGLRHNLELVDGGLRVPESPCLRMIAGTGPADAGARLAGEPTGRVTWVRPDDHSLRSRTSIGVVEVGTLAGGGHVVDLAVSCGQLWALTSEGIARYRRRDRQLLGRVAPQPAGPPLAIASDGSGGVWSLEPLDDCDSTVRHHDCWGRATGWFATVPGPADERSRLATTDDGSHVVVLHRGSGDRLWVIEVCPEPECRALSLRTDSPVALAVDSGDRIQLVGDDPCGDGLWLESLTLSGEVEARHRLDPPPGFGPVSDLAAADGLVVAGAGGLAAIERAPKDGEHRVSTFLSPTLASVPPDSPQLNRSGTRRAGWHRLEIDATLPRGTTLEIAWATSSDEAVTAAADAVFADRGLSPTAKFSELERLLPWRAGDGVLYRSDAVDENRREQLAALVDSTDQTYLWFRLRLVAPAGAESPSVQSVDVRYPAMSYIEDLPATYQHEPSSAAQLRRLLAPFEVLFDELDATIDDLGDRLDPDLAPDAWTATLLRWLGMPVLDDLPADTRRELLLAAPALLADRGTERALVRALEIITGSPVRVRDHGAGPGSWFLPRPGRPGLARLGIDTIAVAKQPPSFRPGRAVLGQTPLGVGCTDPQLALAQRAGLVEVRIELYPERAEVLRPVIDRILSVFAPAHCRLDIDDSPGPRGDRTSLISRDFHLPAADGDPGDGGRLHSDTHWRLGATTMLGAWRVTTETFSTAVVDHTIIDHGETHLI